MLHWGKRYLALFPLGTDIYLDSPLCLGSHPSTEYLFPLHAREKSCAAFYRAGDVTCPRAHMVRLQKDSNEPSPKGHHAHFSHQASLDFQPG